MNGKCYYCNKDLTERTIKRHIKSCKDIKKVISDEIDLKKDIRNQFIISLKDKYDKNTYCIYLSIDENLQLQHLDKFIRDVWVECCGHLSAFNINNIKYNDNSNDLYQMNVKLKDVLHVGDKFEYQYDFGSTTYIILEVVEKIEVSKNHSQIEIIARNNENHYECNKCGEKAQYYQYGTGYYLCEKCAEKLDDDEFEKYGIEELYGDYFNSPRDGVCGYEGDRNAEVPYMPGNKNKYKISRKKPVLEDDEFDFFNDYDTEDNPLLERLLNHTLSCNGEIKEEDIENIIQEEFLKEYSNIFEETTNEFINGIEEIFRKGIFSFQLKELLNNYTKEQIKNLAENLNVKIPSNLNKNQYIEKLYDNYIEAIKNKTYLMDEEKYKILLKCIKNNGILHDVEEDIEKFMYLSEKGILFPAINNKENVFIMPIEVQNIVNEMNTIEVRNKLKNNSEIIKIFIGMIKAYGILSYEDVIMLLKRYINNFDKDEVILLLEENVQYYIYKYNIVKLEDIFNEDNDDSLFFINSDIGNYKEILLDRDRNIDYYYISKEELINMADSFYLEKSKIGKEFLKETLELFCMSKEEALYNMDMLVLDIQTRNSNEIVNDVLNGIDAELELRDKLYVEKVFNDLLKNVPIWKFKGATINQMENKSPNEKIKNIKVGRNEMCPCGSGKKYKNCCGKVINLF